ncbi:MAG: hypothetical protein WBB01_19820 [Phormidesmis sp.]
MPPSSKREQSAIVSLALENQDPLPADPQGQRLCEIFGRYLWCSIYADAPEDISKPKWYTQRRYPLKSRVLWREWQDAAHLIGVRPGHDTVYALLDIDINSPYHPAQDVKAIARIQAALETIGITRTLVIRSSWSKGIHLYVPLPLAVKTFDLAVALQSCLEAQGFRLKPGDLEIFPNVKAYGVTQKIEYRAHRLPLQPGSGSCLLDAEFNPASNQLGDFLAQWDTAAAGQDVTTLQKALPIARQNRRKKVRKRLNKAESWKADLETLMSEGWTGLGQTNQLLKEFGCYGVVFLELRGEDLVDFIHQQAISSPGYRKWCRHQREIEMRSRVWAASVESYYWPLGSYSDVRKTAKNDIVPFNELRSQQAQANIRAAVRHLEATDQLPEQPTARAQAIRRAQADTGATSSSLETLYRDENKKLWHPDFYKESQDEAPVITAAADVSSRAPEKEAIVVEPLEPSENGKLRTKGEIMKCAHPKPEVSSSAKTKFYSGKGGAGGEESFPQANSSSDSSVRSHFGKQSAIPQQKKVTPGFPARTAGAKGISKEVYETIVATQATVRKLNWSAEKITAFIAGKFQGRRTSQLSDEERMELLYYLRAEDLVTS